MGSPATRIRVLFLTPSMVRGGAQSFITGLLRGLDRVEFAPELGLMVDSIMDYELPGDVPVHTMMDVHGFPAVRIDWPGEARPGSDPGADWLTWIVGQTAEFVRRISPDVVFCSPEWASVIASAAACGFPPSTALVCRVDAPVSMAFPAEGVDGLLRVLAAHQLDGADRIAAVSGPIAAELTDCFGVEPARVSVVHNAVDIARVTSLAQLPVEGIPVPGVPTLVFVGRLEAVKGVDVLLQALSSAAPRGRLHCVVVGDGGQAGPLRDMTARLGLEDRVRFVGSQDNPFKYMAAATALVLPSHSEGLPTVLLEAMACGCPIVATDVAGGAIRELLDDGACGVIVPPGDPAALAEAISRVCEDAGLRERLSRAGRTRAERFDLPLVVRENEEIISAAAGTASSRESRPERTCSAIVNVDPAGGRRGRPGSLRGIARAVIRNIRTRGR